MADEVIRRSGSAADHGSFTGASGEWTHDTTLKAIRVHDGSQAGGFPIFHEGYVESAPDGGTDAYSTDARRPVSAGETVRADFTSANTTTTPTFENTQGTPSGALTITTKDGSALWAGALSGVHELQLASGGGSWLVLDPNPLDGDQPASVSYVDARGTSLETLVDATNGGSNDLTEIDWTGIPSGIKRITVMLSDVSLSGSDDLTFLLGDSGGFEFSGYSCIAGVVRDTNSGLTKAFTSSFGVFVANASANVNGAVVFELIDEDTNLWSCHGQFCETDNNRVLSVQGTKALSAELDRVRLGASGTDTFDSGSVNISYGY